jgi:hypothetical protein
VGQRKYPENRGKLNILFWSLTHAQVVISDGKHEYNHHRTQRWVSSPRQLRCRLHPLNRHSHHLDQLAESRQLH